MYNNDPKYMNPPEAGLASLLASRGRDGDSVLVHMAPQELQGLQQIAMAHGGSLSVNPETGLYEASFLKKILPMIAGAVLPSIPGVGQFAKTIGFGSEALGTALLVGGATGLIEGDLKKGLMAGLGAYSGATLSEGLKAASVAGKPSEIAAEAVPAAEAAKAGQAVDTARGTVGATAEATRLSDVGGVFSPKMTTPPAISGISIKPVDYTPYAPPPPTPSVMGGISALMRPEGRSAFMGAMGGGFQSPLAQNLSKYAVMTGVADALTPQPKAMPMGGGASEDIVYIPGGYNPQYGTGKDQPFQLPGKYYKRTPQGLVPYNPWQLAPGARGFAAGGAVQLLDDKMNMQWVNPSKPMPYMGEQKFAEGGPVQGPIRALPYLPPTNDPNVLATRAYIEELNRRARFPYGMQGAGGMGGEGTGILGGGYPFIPGTSGAGTGGGGGGAGSGLGALAGGIAANYLINKGIGAGVDYLRDKFGGEQQKPYREPISDSLQGVDLSALPASMAAVNQLSALNTAPPKTYSYQVEEVPDVTGSTPATTRTPSSSVPYTTAALTGLNAISPFMNISPLPPTRTTVEPVSYEGEEMVVREDPTVTQQTRPPATSSIPYTTGTLAGLNVLSPFMNISPLPPTRTTVEPVSYEGEEMVVREDPAITQQTRPPATSSVPYTTGTLAGLSALNPFLNATRLPATATTVTPVSYEGEDIVINDDAARKLDADLQAKTRVGDVSRPLSSYLSAGSSGLAGLASLGSAAKTGLTSIIPLDPATGAVQTFLSPGSSAAANAAAAESAKAAGAEVAGAGTGAGAASKIIPGLQTALGLYETYKGIESGKEGRAALGAYGAATGAATLAGYSGLAALGPIGVAAAAIAAIGASMVNTKEFGDVALRNYWNAVDSGRGVGETDPVELAQGFINFYRTNKNEFAGQQAYGRTGNEQFLYDMTQVINDAVKSGKVDKNVDAGTMYQQVVQPWLNSMGSGPQNEDAKRIQDFMMTDLINSFMQGKPISNAQVKGDTKFDIVSKKPTYAGETPPTQELAIPTTPDIQDLVRQAAERQSGVGTYNNIFEPRTPFAELGADESQRVTALPQRREEDFISSTMPVKPPREPGYELPPVGNLTPLPFEEPVGPTPLSLPEELEAAPPVQLGGDEYPIGTPMPVRATTPVPEEPIYVPYYAENDVVQETLRPSDYMGYERESIMPVEATTPIPEEPYYAPVNPYAEQEARRIEQERFAREQETFRQAEAQRVEQERMARQAEIDRQEMARQAAYQRQMEYEAQQAAARAEAIRQAEIEAVRRAEEDRARFYVPREEAVPITSSIMEEPYYAAVQPESVPIEQYYAPVEPYNPYGEFYNPYSFADFAPESFMFAQGGAIGDDYNFGFAGGGMPPMPEYRAGGKLLRGRGDGMSDDIPAVIRGKGEQRAALADGEFVVPADVVSHLGNGSTNAGAKKLYQMMARVRQARTGKSRQAPAVKVDRYLPA